MRCKATNFFFQKPAWFVKLENAILKNEINISDDSSDEENEENDENDENEENEAPTAYLESTSRTSEPRARSMVVYFSLSNYCIIYKCYDYYCRTLASSYWYPAECCKQQEVWQRACYANVNKARTPMEVNNYISNHSLEEFIKLKNKFFQLFKNPVLLRLQLSTAAENKVFNIMKRRIIFDSNMNLDILKVVEDVSNWLTFFF